MRSLGLLIAVCIFGVRGESGSSAASRALRCVAKPMKGPNQQMSVHYEGKTNSVWVSSVQPACWGKVQASVHRDTHKQCFGNLSICLCQLQDALVLIRKGTLPGMIRSRTADSEGRKENSDVDRGTDAHYRQQPSGQMA